MSELADGAAFVTGGGSGIGREIALAFARLGTPVAVMDLHTETAEQVAEQGRHAELLARGGLYARLHDLQFGAVAARRG